MRLRRLFASATLLAVFALPSNLAAKPNLYKGPLYVAEVDRDVLGDRAIQIVLDTTEIGAMVELGRIAETTSSGSYGDYYWSAGPFHEAAGINMLATREAEVKVAPLRKALDGFFGGNLAIEAARSGLSQAAWMRPNPIEVFSQSSNSNPLDFVDAAPTAQVGILNVGYYLSHDGGQIEARADFRLFKKVKKKVSVIAYQTAISVVRLPKPYFDPNANVRTWSANDGEAARRAITMANSRLGKLITRMLALRATDITTYSNSANAMAQAAGRYGPVLERGQDGSGSLILWSKGLIAVQNLPE